MNKGEIIKTQEELIQLLENQVVDITMMSKIELGDDVILEVRRLKKKLNQPKTKRKIEKKCHACMGVWWQVKKNKKIIFKSKRKKDCTNYLNQNKDGDSKRS